MTAHELDRYIASKYPWWDFRYFWGLEVGLELMIPCHEAMVQAGKDKQAELI